MTTKKVASAENIWYGLVMMTPEQCRAARGWLDWTQNDLALKAGVGLSTVKDFEKGGRKIGATAAAIRRAIESAGIHLLEDQAGTAAGIARADAGAVRVSDRDA